MSLPTPPGPQQPPGAGCVPWGVEGVERGRGVAQAVVQELRCPWHPREHLMAPAFALRSGTRDTANMGQEGGTVPGELWGPSLNTRCCLIPWGWRPPWPAGTGSLGTAEGWRSRQPPALWVWREGMAWGSYLSLPPSHPVTSWQDVGLAAGSGHRAAPRHQYPAGTLLLYPAAHLCSSTQQGEGGSSPLWKRPSLGGALSPQGPCLLPAAGSSPVPSPSLMVHTVIF